ncbi:STAS domain-containing protein [Symbioplanes lichenis]|uniref:STAS domain-containing protein n=1 Tax=Symbioplanes lichenis TaxID=1629072 RepID=UPI00273860EE|nr:STAS domain-containing protein [Actinoplanes lichenis]
MTQSFAVRRHDAGGGVAHLVVVGEIDAETSEVLLALIANAAGRPGTAELVVDLRRVGFLDAAGARALLRGADAVDRHGVGYRLANPGGSVRRVLEVAGVTAQVPVVDLLPGRAPDCPAEETPFAVQPGG